MIKRREFLHLSGATLAICAAPFDASLSADQPRMATRLIPGTNEKLPVIGLGNSEPFGRGDLERSQQLVDLLLDRGGSYIDTTGQSRFTVAEIMRDADLQQRLFVGTYVETQDDPSARAEISAVREAQGDGAPLDLLLTRNIDDYLARSSQYQQLRADGLTRFLGVARHQARYHDRMIQLMKDGVVDFLQVNYSMMEPEAGESLLPMAREKKVAILVNRPFINGDYFGLVRDRELPDWAEEFDCQSWAQFSLKWILGNPAVNCVLTETSNPRHAIDNLGGGFGRLPDEATRDRMRALLLSFV
jgi:diketogulonate reductase-like aldo/keto reductase